MNHVDIRAANREWAQQRMDAETILARCHALGLRPALQARGVIFGWSLVRTEWVTRTILEVIAEAFPMRWVVEYANATERARYGIARYRVIIEHIDHDDDEVEVDGETLVDGLYAAITDWLALRRCRQCGCTDQFACVEGCHWVDAALCSRCVEQEDSAK